MNQIGLEALTLEEIELIDAACDSFRSRWQTNSRIDIDSVLVSMPDELELPLALELIELEISLRQGAGESPSITEYCQRYPLWSAEIHLLGIAGSNSVAPAPQHIELPKQIPGYELGEELGRGGMGVVFKALHKGLGRYVALKMAILQGGTNRNEIDRFRTEAESAARLHHPNIAQIFEIGSVDNVPYYTMELVEGGNLNQALARQPLGPASAAELLASLAQAVGYAHDMGIVHRDLKPSNILIQTRPSSAGSSSVRKEGPLSRASTSTGWIPKITDFGLAKKIDSSCGLTMTGVVVGTPDYISPEQTYGRSDEVGPATDIYALGAILYELIVGRPPFRSANLFETLEQVRFKDPVPPSRLQSSVPRDLETICLKCLEKQPHNRYASASELAADLDRFLHGLPIAACPVGKVERTLRWARRNPVMAGMLALIALLTLTVILLPSWLVVQLNQALKVSDAFAIQAAKNESEARARAAAVEQARLITESISRESQSHLVGMRIAAGDSSNNASNSLRALLWYTHAWKDDRYHSRDDFEHRMRIGQAIGLLPHLSGLCLHDQTVDDFHIDASLTRAVLLDEKQHATLWNPLEGQLLGQLDAAASVSNVAWVAKAHCALTTAGQYVRLWNADSLQLEREWTTSAEIKAVDVSGDEVWVAAACGDGTICVWNRETGSSHPRCDTRGAFATIRSTPQWVALAPDNQALLVVDEEQRLHVWNMNNGTLITDTLRHDLFPARKKSTPQFQRHGRHLLTWADKQFTLIDTSNWQVVARRKTIANVSDFALDQSFQQMVFATHSSLFRWLKVTNDDVTSFETSPLLDTLTPRQTMLCAQSSAGTLAAVSSSGGVIHLYKSEKQELLARLRVLGEVTQLRFVELNNGQQALAASGWDGAVRIWTLDQSSLQSIDFDCEQEFSWHGLWINRDGRNTTLSPDGTREVTFINHAVQLSQREQQETIATIQFDDQPRHISFASTSRSVAISDKTCCRVIDWNNGKCIGEPYRGQTPILKVQLSNDAQRLLIWRAGEVASVWDVKSQTQLLGNESSSAANDYWRKSQGHEMGDVCLSSDGEQLVQRRQLCPRTEVYRVDSGQLIAETDIQIGVPTPIALSKRTSRFLIGNSDTRARVWDAARGQAVGPLLQHPSFVRFGCLSPDGNLAATYAADGRLRIWNPTHGDLIVSGEMALQRGRFWFGNDSRRLFIRRQSGAMHEIMIPRWECDLNLLDSLVQLHSCERIDETQGIADLTVEHFRTHREQFIEAWHASRSLY